VSYLFCVFVAKRKQFVRVKRNSRHVARSGPVVKYENPVWVHA